MKGTMTSSSRLSRQPTKLTLLRRLLRRAERQRPQREHLAKWNERQVAEWERFLRQYQEGSL